MVSEKRNCRERILVEENAEGVPFLFLFSNTERGHRGRKRTTSSKKMKAIRLKHISRGWIINKRFFECFSYFFLCDAKNNLCIFFSEGTEESRRARMREWTKSYETKLLVQYKKKRVCS